MGYRRPDGRVGIRNKVLIMPTCVCSADVARIVSSNVNGTVTFHNQNGCGQIGKDFQMTMDIEAGYAANPNVYGTVLIGLGCEEHQVSLVTEAIRKRTNKPLVSFVIQEVGGTIKTVELATRAAQKMVIEASRVSRIECNVSELILGTNCGGSDPTSGVSANVVMGYASDKLVGLGGTSILSETPELLGAEHILAGRAVNEEVAKSIYRITKDFEDHFKNVGYDVRDGDPSPGNFVGGITTLEEKSLGCIKKAGNAPIQAVIEYAHQIDNIKGLVIMDTESHDPSSVAAMAAGGAQMCVFSSGRGSPTGNPIIPVIKITGNKFTFEKMSDNIDFDTSGMLYGQSTIEELGEDLFELILDVAEGMMTKNEILGITEMAIGRQCNYT